MKVESPRRGEVENGAWLAGGVTILLWSSAFTAINVGLHGYSPPHLTLLRFAVASGFFALLAPFFRIHIPHRHDVAQIALTGVCGITVYHLALNLGQVSVPAGTAGLIIGTAPVFTALLSHRFLGERLYRWGWIGIGVSFLGLGVIFLGQGESIAFSVGALLIMMAAISGSAYFVLVKSLLAKYGALQVTAYVTWVGTIPLLLLGRGIVGAIAHAPLASTLAIVYAGIFPAAIAYVTWGKALERAPASQVAPLLFVSPILGMGVAWIWIREVPTLATLAGGVIALVGVAIVRLRGNSA